MMVSLFPAFVVFFFSWSIRDAVCIGIMLLIDFLFHSWLQGLLPPSHYVWPWQAMVKVGRKSDLSQNVQSGCVCMYVCEVEKRWVYCNERLIRRICCRGTAECQSGILFVRRLLGSARVSFVFWKLLVRKSPLYSRAGRFFPLKSRK